MDDTIFDSSASPVDFDLTSTIAGWGRVLPEFNNAIDFTVNSDGTVIIKIFKFLNCKEKN